MKLELTNKKIAIAGASRGIGLGIAQAFHDEGAQVWLTGRSEEALKKAAALMPGAQFTVCDLENTTGRETFARDLKTKWGALDTLVLNIGGVPVSDLGFKPSDEDWLKMFNLNFFSHVSLIGLFQDLLAKSSNGSVVSISSIAGETRLTAPLAYSTAKAALNHLCGSAASELGALGVRFNVVSPGNILYSGGRWEQRMNTAPDEIKKMLDSNVPLKRFGTPAEIAAFVLFLASPRASFCTGSVIRVDGGQSPVT